MTDVAYAALLDVDGQYRPTPGSQRKMCRRAFVFAAGVTFVLAGFLSVPPYSTGKPTTAPKPPSATRPTKLYPRVTIVNNPNELRESLTENPTTTQKQTTMTELPKLSRRPTTVHNDNEVLVRNFGLTASANPYEGHNPEAKHRLADNGGIFAVFVSLSCFVIALAVYCRNRHEDNLAVGCRVTWNTRDDQDALVGIPATIEGVNGDGTYTLRWDNGSTDDRVKRSCELQERPTVGDMVKVVRPHGKSECLRLWQVGKVICETHCRFEVEGMDGLHFQWDMLERQATNQAAAKQRFDIQCSCIIAIGFLFMVLAMPFLMRMNSPGDFSFSVPPSSSPPPTDCVVFFGEVILFPLWFTVLSVASIMAFNFLCIKAHALYDGNKYPASLLLDTSFANPSFYFVIPTGLQHLVMFAVFMVKGGHVGGWIGYTVAYMLWHNSGMEAFFISSVFGSYLAKSFDPSPWETGTELIDLAVAIVRCLGMLLKICFGMLLLLLHVPTFITHVCPAMLRWAWLAFVIQSFTCLVIVVFYRPASSVNFVYAYREAWNTESKFWAFGLFFFATYMAMLLPVYPLVELFCITLNLKGIGIRLMKPGIPTLVSSALVLTTSVTLQTYFNISALSYAGVAYWDVIPLSIASRHWKCNSHVLFDKVMDEEHMASTAWASLISLFN